MTEILPIGRLTALGVELPEQVEQDVLSFMRDGIGMSGLFTAKAVREGILDLMLRTGRNISKLPANWDRRIVDALFLREKQAGRIETFGAGRGPNVLWRLVKRIP